MKDKLVMIEDTYAHAFLMEIWTPSSATNFKFWNCDRTRYQNGDWEAKNMGFIRYRVGDCFLADPKSPYVNGYCFSGAGGGTFVDLFIGESGANDVNYEFFKWGMVLHDYVDGQGVKDSGNGEVKQSWVMGLQPGRIYWKIASQTDVIKVYANASQVQVPSAPRTDAAR